MHHCFTECLRVKCLRIHVVWFQLGIVAFEGKSVQTFEAWIAFGQILYCR